MNISSELRILHQHEASSAKDRGIIDDTPVFVSGSGAKLVDSTGREYIDFLSGSGVANAGHGNAKIAEAVSEQMKKGLLQTGPQLVSRQKALLIEKIVEVTPPKLNRVHLTVTGGEGVEAAIKAARAHTGRQNIIAFWGGYHGRTLGSLALTSHKSYRNLFLPVTFGTAHFPYPFHYRNPFGSDEQSEEELSRFILNMVENAIQDPASGLGPTAAIILEPIQAVAGIVVPPVSFMQGLREICDRNGILLIADEIFCGFGRTGEWFGSNISGVEPDLMVIAKGLGSGLPISALVGTEEVLGNVPQNIISSTYEGNVVACAAAVASVSYLQSIDAPAKAANIGRVIKAWSAGLPQSIVGEVRGAGALWGIEIVASGTRTPDSKKAKRIQQALFGQGVIIYLSGRYGNVVGIVPPLVCDDQTLAAGLNAIGKAITAEAA